MYLQCINMNIFFFPFRMVSLREVVNVNNHACSRCARLFRNRVICPWRQGPCSFPFHFNCNPLLSKWSSIERVTSYLRKISSLSWFLLHETCFSANSGKPIISAYVTERKKARKTRFSANSARSDHIIEKRSKKLACVLSQLLLLETKTQATTRARIVLSYVELTQEAATAMMLQAIAMNGQTVSGEEQEDAETNAVFFFLLWADGTMHGRVEAQKK